VTAHLSPHREMVAASQIDEAARSVGKTQLSSHFRPAVSSAAFILTDGNER
jgi:hypothetical protein